MTIRAVLLDKDGTLVDFQRTWVPAYATAAQAICAEHASTPGVVAELLALGGLQPGTEAPAGGSLIACGTVRELVELWADHLGIVEVDRLEAGVEAGFDLSVRGRPVAVEGLADEIAALASRGLALGVATMDSEAGARQTLDALGLARDFDFVVGCDSGFGVKPGPGMAQAFCCRLGLAPERIVVVGDTRHDCAMGRSAGAGLVVGVLTGAASAAELHAHCDALLESVVGLESLLDGAGLL